MKILKIIVILTTLIALPALGGSYNLNLHASNDSVEAQNFSDLLENSTRFHDRYVLGIDWKGVAKEVIEESNLPSAMAMATANKVAADLLRRQGRSQPAH